MLTSEDWKQVTEVTKVTKGWTRMQISNTSNIFVKFFYELSFGLHQFLIKKINIYLAL